MKSTYFSYLLYLFRVDDVYGFIYLCMHGGLLKSQFSSTTCSGINFKIFVLCVSYFYAYTKDRFVKNEDRQ